MINTSIHDAELKKELTAKIYIADDELACILISNQYKEVRSSAQASHENLTGRRNFAIFKKNVTSSTPHILFENKAIREKMFQFYERTIDEKHLRTMLCFHKISGSLGIMIRNRFRNDWSIETVSKFFAELQSEESESSSRISLPLRKRILAAYESVVM